MLVWNYTLYVLKYVNNEWFHIKQPHLQLTMQCINRNLVGHHRSVPNRQLPTTREAYKHALFIILNRG